MSAKVVIDRILYFLTAAFFCLLTFVMMGGYRFIIAGGDFSDATVHDSQTPLQMAFTYGSFGLGFALILLRLLRAGTVARRAWPLYILPLLALMSALWSIDAQVTVMRSVILMAICCYGIGVVSYFEPRRILQMYVITGLAIVFLSVLTALLLPQIGVHQMSDASQSTHAGSWRGVFSHRTQLGQFCAVFIVVCIACRTMVWRLPVAVAVIAALVCMVKAASTGAFLTLFVGCATFFLLKIFASRGMLVQVVFLFFAVIGGIIFGVAKDDLAAPFLEALGKSSDLTGRTILWDTLNHLAAGKDALGFGYSAGIKFFLSTLPSLEGVPNAQSAFLDMKIAFGYVGTGIIVVSWLALSLKILRAMNVARMMGQPDLPLIQNGLSLSVAMVAMVAQMAVGESFYMETNNFLWPTLTIVIPAFLSLALDPSAFAIPRPIRRRPAMGARLPLAPEAEAEAEAVIA